MQEQFDSIDALAQGHYTLLFYSKRSSSRYRKLYDLGLKPGKWDTFWRGTDRKTMRYELFGITPESGQWRWEPTRTKQAVANYERYRAEATDLHIEEFATQIEEEIGKRPDFVRLGDKGQPQWYQYSRDFRLASDVWTVKSAGSVTGFPTEKHEDLLERIISWLTDKGDLVLDAFSGSGTTVAVSERLGRRWIGIDATKYAIHTATARLLRQRQRDETYGSTFTLNMAGLYDYELLRFLPWEEYKAFVLSLFQCRAAADDVRGVHFDGLLDDDRVLVYNFTEYPEAKIGEEFVADLARLCGESLGDRCFIIAPALTVAPYEDYLDVQGTRFYFLRIPYSLIAELHKRRFTELRQPTSLTATNTVMDSIGFDFIQQPRVECKYQTDGETLTISILEFESEAYAASPSEENIADLAMVLVDYDYDGEIFDVDAVYYAEDLKAADWRVQVVNEDVGDRLMIVYLDVYGNELRETKSSDDFVPAAIRGRSRKKTTRRRSPRVGRTTARATRRSKDRAQKSTKKGVRTTSGKKKTPAKTPQKKTSQRKGATGAKSTRSKSTQKKQNQSRAAGTSATRRKTTSTAKGARGKAGSTTRSSKKTETQTARSTSRRKKPVEIRRRKS